MKLCTKRRVLKGTVGLFGLTVAMQFASGCRLKSSSVKEVTYEGSGTSEFSVTGRDYVIYSADQAAKDAAIDANSTANAPVDDHHHIKYLASQRQIADGIFLEHYLSDKEAEDPNINYGRFNAEVRFSDDSDPQLTQDANDPTKWWFNFKFTVAGYDNMLKKIRADAYQATAARAEGNRQLKELDFYFATPDLDAQTLVRTQPGKEWFRDDVWKFWSPDNNTSRVAVRNSVATIVPKTPAPDSFLPVDQMIVTAADGSKHIPVAVHFGWDGEAQGADVPPGGYRFEVVLAKKLYKKLRTKLGFTVPTDNFFDYHPFDANQAPITKMITVNGQPVSVDVTIVFAGQHFAMGGPIGADSDPWLVKGPDPEIPAGAAVARSKMAESLQTKKVVLYLGHSGVRTGFNFGDWFQPGVGDAGTFYAVDLQSTPMMNSYQLVVADGCQTYYLTDNFRRNAAKTDPSDPNNPDKFKNLNLITSLGFTDADSIATVMKLLKAITRQDDQGNNNAPLVSKILNGYNPKDQISYWKYVRLPPQKAPQTPEEWAKWEEADDDPIFPMYGVHGTDNNPRGNPLANKETFAKSCGQPSDCGPGEGNLCINTNSIVNLSTASSLALDDSAANGSKHCTMTCIDDTGCPSVGRAKGSCKLPQANSASSLGFCRTPAVGGSINLPAADQ